ncbi:unnamed protein product [Symbiodinium sp. CCMP2592]|nr:unnamed protein product [Symbiodinium sp. CCMP2592]
MKPGIFELSKCRASDLREALPRFNRQDTKKSMEKEVLGKVGACARLQLQLQGLDEAEGVLVSLKTMKDALEAKYKDLKMLDDTVDEAEWQEKVKEVAKAYLLFVSKEVVSVAHAASFAHCLRLEAKEAKNQPRLSSTLQGAGIGYTGGPSDLPARFHGDEGPGQKYKNVLVINMSFPFSHSGHLIMVEFAAEGFASLVCPRHWKGNGEANGNRFASTVDPVDGQTFLSPGSGHYMNCFGDSPWELCGLESKDDFLQELLKAHGGSLPEICNITGFHNKLIHYDTLHVCYRGFAPDLVASVMLDIFPDRGGLIKAHDLCCLWAKANGAELACDDFILNADEKYATLNAKGADIKLVCLWLALGI